MLVFILAFVTSCGGGGSSAKSSGTPSTGSGPTGTSINNVIPISVNGSSLNQAWGINAATVSVKVCTPGTSTCQTIDNILLDTGSTGLRIFKQALTTVPLSQLTTSSGGSLANCVQYDDNTADWGPVQMAGIILGNEPAVQTPIQVIDSTFGDPTVCAEQEYTLDTDPTTDGYNGLLGIGLYAQDCGSYCETVQNPIPSGWPYFSCNGSSCTATAVSTSSQLQNPVALLPKDNNGVIVELPSISDNGMPSASGSLVLGIGTESNNIPPSTVKVYLVDDNPNDPNYTDFNTWVNGTYYPYSFIDSGSNALFFSPPTGTTSLPVCSDDSGWFCPASTTSFTAITSGYNDTNPNSGTEVSFQIGNYDTLVNDSSNWVFNDIGGTTQAGEFDWGLPFYFGRDVYQGIEGRWSSLGTGPYWAY